MSGTKNRNRAKQQPSASKKALGFEEENTSGALSKARLDFKKKWLVFAWVVLVFLLLLGGWKLLEQAKPLQLTVTGLNEVATVRLLDYFRGQKWLDRDTILAELNTSKAGSKNTVDIVIGPWAVPKDSSGFEPIPGSFEGTIGRSIGATGLGSDGKRLAIPIALDHVELAFRRDLFTQKGLVVQERILSLADLEGVLRKLIDKDFYPLMVAGGQDRDLLDFVAALTLSTGGLEAYESVSRQLVRLDWQSDNLRVFLAEAPELAEALEVLRRWKFEGILHPEWSSFKKADVLAMAERRLTAACIMRLSEHRTWPVAYLRSWQSSPFPFKDPGAAGTALLSPVIVASVPVSGRFAKKLAPLLTTFIEAVFQESVVQDWGLAPVLSTAKVVDREAGDLRFWAVASRQLLSGWDAELGYDSVAKLAAGIRDILR